MEQMLAECAECKSFRIRYDALPRALLWIASLQQHIRRGGGPVHELDILS